ncbi:DUF2269 domain-containing protein [Herbiconiux sp. CPCC 205763]|uniref:DUF2269 domain-containing protein n=1 Tax=Herbiconiux aconitum TaxID=2970913 RepID=A0ABT2GLM1_9MICO|nr:DUF2269 domain-containing protein [Herbiconiux aconitum]MCS5717114.1 DUF2269 domain-containing protein [Herbiconiux aconitum]
METLFSVLHVVGAVFIVGPMAILPMTALRAIRAGNTAQVRTLAKSTMIFSYLSLIVFVLGFGLVGMADEKYALSLTTPWVLWSIIAYVVAIVLNLVVVVPSMRRAGAAAEPSGAATAGAGGVATAGGAATAGGTNQRSGYPAISAGSGIVSLLLVLVVVLMVWKP